MALSNSSDYSSTVREWLALKNFSMSSIIVSSTGELNYVVGGEMVEILRFAQDDTVHHRCDGRLPYLG